METEAEAIARRDKARIILLWLESYNEYLHDFIRTEHLEDETKARFASKNAEEFLFG